MDNTDGTTQHVQYAWLRNISVFTVHSYLVFKVCDRGVSSRISLVESVVSARQSDSKVNDLLQV